MASAVALLSSPPAMGVKGQRLGGMVACWSCDVCVQHVAMSSLRGSREKPSLNLTLAFGAAETYNVHLILRCTSLWCVEMCPVNAQFRLEQGPEIPGFHVTREYW